MSVTFTLHFSSHWRPHSYWQLWLQPCLTLLHGFKQYTALCSPSEWHLLTQECPQGRRCPHRRSHPASGETLEKSSGEVTARGVSGWRGQQSSSCLPTLSPLLSIVSTSFHIGTWDDVSVFPMMYIPCCALDSNTLILFEVFRNPHLRCWLHRTSEITTTLASSPLQDIVSH